MMNRHFAINSCWLSALLLLGLTACDKAVDPNPNVDPDENTVKTKFVLSISTGSQGTKMSADVVQQDGNPFRGMTDAHLLTFSYKDKGAQGGYYMFQPEAIKAKVATRDYNLGSLVGAREIDDDQKNSRTIELAMPLDVNSVMIYGKATKTGSDAAQGALENIAWPALVGSSMDDLSFRLKNRLKSQEAYDGMCNLLAEALTMLVDAELVKSTSGTGVDTRYAFWWPIDDTSKDTANYPLDDTYNNGDEKNGYTYYHSEYVWAALGDIYGNRDKDPDKYDALSPLEQILAKAYYELTTIRHRDGDETVQELRAGAASSVLYMLRDLSERMDQSRKGVPVSPHDEMARQLAEEICRRISFFFNGEGGSIRYKRLDTLLMVASQAFPAAYYDEKIDKYRTYLLDTQYGNFLPNQVTLEGGFPVNLGLPQSAALMTCKRNSTTGKMVYEYLPGVPAYGMSADMLPITNYRFPPELMYWGNAGLRVSDMSTDKLVLPRSVSYWAEDENWTSDWVANGVVNSMTRSIAMMQQVSYGTALLRSTVKAASTVKDNRQARTGESDQSIDVLNNPNSFLVTGIFIGGVADVVGWDFIRKNDNLPAGVSSNKFDKMIYDEVDSYPVYSYDSTYPEKPIYTLVWDNYMPKINADGVIQGDGIGEQKDQVDVYVAVELVNNTGKDLWGELNMIRNGGTFYLVGKLDIKKAIADNSALDEDQQLSFPDPKLFHYPPFDADGNTVKVKRIFMQDYMTNVTLRLEQESIKHAYMTIPDLRASQISLGLSVDLKWKAGLNFSVELGKVDDN